MKKIGVSTVLWQNLYGDFKALDLAKESGADAVDFDLAYQDYRKPESHFSKSDEEIVDYYKKVRAYADELGIEISQTHGRVQGYKDIPEEDEALIKNARLDCMATAAMGVKYCVMHGSTSIYMGPEPDGKLMHKLNFEMFNRILVFAKEFDVIVATETFGGAMKYDVCDFFGNVDEFMITYNRICAVGDNAKYLKICMDTGHTNRAVMYGNPSVGNVIRMLGKNIVCLHINDNDGGMKDQHKMPTMGEIDWKDVMDALDEIGYDGVYNMEIDFQKYCGEARMLDGEAFAVKVMRDIANRVLWK